MKKMVQEMKAMVTAAALTTTTMVETKQALIVRLAL
jgi:hypothetical protein